MEWKQFLSNLVESLAWPSIAAIFLYMFKNELSNIVTRVAHFKYKDLELDFGKVKQQADELRREEYNEVPTLKSPELNSLEDQIFDAVERAPSAAILLAWSGVETAMASAVARLCISLQEPSYRSPMHNIEMLSRHGGLDKSDENLLREMRLLRNKIAHERDAMINITQEQATDYANVAKSIIKNLDSMKLDDD
jgi:uncharacterized protein YutE (UPF0331/DUF86 family)